MFFQKEENVNNLKQRLNGIHHLHQILEEGYNCDAPDIQKIVEFSRQLIGWGIVNILLNSLGKSSYTSNRSKLIVYCLLLTQ